MTQRKYTVNYTNGARGFFKTEKEAIEHFRKFNGVTVVAPGGTVIKKRGD
jgi:hypothetical protein